MHELERLAEDSDAGTKAKRRRVWGELMRMFKAADTREVVRLLSSELQLQPITVKRWISGEFNPRQSHIARMRVLLGLSQNAPSALSVPLGDRPDPPVAFDNSFAAMRTINHYFFCLKFAKYAFVFKGSLGYHAGRPGASREAVVSTLQHKQSALKMFYFYVDGSAAATTFKRFIHSPLVVNSGVKDAIHWVCIPRNKDKMGLSYSSVSPLILIYDEDGCRTFDRFLDVFFEIPVEFLRPDNRSIDEFTLKTTFVQQPEPEARRFWKKAAEYLAELSIPSEIISDVTISIPEDRDAEAVDFG